MVSAQGVDLDTNSLSIPVEFRDNDFASEPPQLMYDGAVVTGTVNASVGESLEFIIIDGQSPFTITGTIGWQKLSEAQAVEIDIDNDGDSDPSATLVVTPLDSGTATLQYTR